MGGPRTVGTTAKPLDVFRAAADAEHSCAVLQADIPRTAKASPRGSEILFHTVIPLGIVTAYTIELYMKCLLRIDHGGWGQGHNLVELFNELSAQRQADIRATHAHYMATDPRELAKVAGLKKVLGALGVSMPDPPKSDFDSLLEMRADIFVKWRYWFDDPKGILTQEGIVYPDSIARSVRGVILKDNPGWQSWITHVN